MPQTTERSQRPALRGGMPSRLSRRVISAMLSLDGIHLIDAPHYTGLGFIDNVGGARLFRLADITVAIGSAAHYPLFPCMGTVSLATPRALQDLGSFVFRDHALELHQEFDLQDCGLAETLRTTFPLRGGKLFDQQNLVSILSAQSV